MDTKLMVNQSNPPAPLAAEAHSLGQGRWEGDRRDPTPPAYPPSSVLFRRLGAMHVSCGFFVDRIYPSAGAGERKEDVRWREPVGVEADGGGRRAARADGGERA